jgi:O-acetyl-ADP-ribose deacetylase (regulator of RNase III)
MIRYAQGNLLEASTEALVNTVNEVGVMGKGVARMFREAFPENAKEYEQAARRGEVRVGHVMVTRHESLVGPKWIIHFPTKKHWRQPSQLQWVREGLGDLVGAIRRHGIRSVALPPLGCGSGGLEWAQVRREIESTLTGLADVEVVVFEPTDTYHNAPKRSGVEELTPARALIAELVRRYSILGIQCTNLEVQKLAWFLHRVIDLRGLHDPLAMQFVPNKYGPYADRLRHLLDGLDGSYLHCEKRLSDAGPLEPIWFEDSRREAVAAYLASESASEFVPALEQTARIIDGFESPLGMELLATVDWLVHEQRCEPTEEALLRCLEQWPGGKNAGARKRKLFDVRLLQLAVARLAVFGAEDSRPSPGV